MIFWLRRGIASPLNFACLVCGFLVFPFVVKWTDAFSIARIDANSPEHTPAFLKFAAILLLFEWTWFFVAWVGIYKYGKVSFRQLIGGKWNRSSEIFRDFRTRTSNFRNSVNDWSVPAAIARPLSERFHSYAVNVSAEQRRSHSLYGAGSHGWLC